MRILSVSFCLTIPFFLGQESTYQDFSKPAKFRLTAKLMDDAAAKEFCANCPVADEKQPKFFEKTMLFASECGADEICEEDLELEAHFPVK